MVRKKRLSITVSQYEDKAEYNRQWRKLNPGYDKRHRDYEKIREAAWRRRYGISREDYERLLKEQDGVCAICSTDTVGRGHEYFHVDHNHETGEVRGLLCDKCNRGLGYFNDNALTLAKASSYLRDCNYKRMLRECKRSCRLASPRRVCSV